MDAEDLASRFTYHPPSGDKILLHQDIRDRGYVLASFLNSALPEGREKSLAITHLEQVVMWANAAVARDLP